MHYWGYSFLQVMWSSCTGAIKSSAVSPYAKGCFSLSREAFEEDVRNFLQWKNSKRVLPSLLSTEVGLAVACCSHPRLPEKGRPNVQAAGKRMVSGIIYVMQAELCICSVMRTNQFKDKTIPERVFCACSISRALVDVKWFIPLGLLKARFTERRVQCLVHLVCCRQVLLL